MGALDVLAENNFGDTRSGGLAGPMGLLIIVLLGIVTIFLIRNMTARIRRLPAEFPDPDADRKADDQKSADPTGSDPDQLDKSTPA
ncbi:hypothetical protein [Dactylosporangium sp. CA-139066]|uniref:hypothetical protein n=1 Tax=Dactylosporangium sp. CA-139066 TaxID=3239930 RepID=UPI003D944545